MYSTCLFCHKSLGANEVIEHLPVGRRLAFDGATGRLWVVCAACRRWNLTPIEEHAERAIRPILAQLNRLAGRPDQVQQAVGQLNRDGDPMINGIQRFGRKPIPLSELNAVDRLSFEMSLAERDEQKLLAGELAGLTLAWREADEIAGIADNLFLPESVSAWLRRQKRKES